MKKLIILLFLFISMPALSNDPEYKITQEYELGVSKFQLFLDVSDVTYALGKPDYVTDASTENVPDGSIFHWFNRYVYVACRTSLEWDYLCYMDKSLEELKIIVEEKQTTMAIFKLIYKIEEK